MGLIGNKVRRRLEEPVREAVETALSERTFVKPGDIADIRAELSALKAEFAGLTGQLELLRGAVQATTAQAAEARRDSEHALATARQASQLATTATSTAEAANDGLVGVEDRLAALMERLGRASAPAPVETKQAAGQQAASKQAEASKRAAAPEAAASTAPAAEAEQEPCRIDGCGDRPRARGFCNAHYRKWRRGTLPGFVTSEGKLFFEGDARVWTVDVALAGSAGARKADTVIVEGAPVHVTKVS